MCEEHSPDAYHLDDWTPTRSHNSDEVTVNVASFRDMKDVLINESKLSKREKLRLFKALAKQLDYEVE